VPPHFHEQTQLVFVLSGGRSFWIGGQPVTVTAGQSLRIPAGVLHIPLGCRPGTTCLNAYLSTGDSDLAPDAGRLRRLLAESDASVGALAGDLGESREGFSRRVVRTLGLPPQAFRRLSRLNRARQLLRDGLPVAAAAADAGFADQSHLGRLFRATFGTTPAAYRQG
jgi:AraC-like DNA-binding protein